MKKVSRRSLTKRSMNFLARRTRAVTAAADPKAKARALWERKPKAFDEIRQVLRGMASGVERCMYCEDSQGTDIDHFWPLADYPSKSYTWENYLLACSHCNSNEKRNQFPLDAAGSPLLINPAVDDPFAHVTFAPTTGKFTHVDQKGLESIRVFNLNRAALEKGRLNAWIAVLDLIVKYSDLKASGQLAEAAVRERVLRQHPFASILVAVLQISAGPGATLVGADVLAAIGANPEIRGWV